MIRLSHGLRCMLAAASVSACGPGEEAAPNRDLSEARVLESDAATATALLSWSIGATPDMTIGTTEGDDPYQLFRVRDAATLGGGHVAVANSGTGEIRVFDREGTYLFTAGRAGEGPGEFTSLSAIGAWPGDSIIGWDARQRRVSVFSGDGAHGRTFRVRNFEDSHSPQFRDVTEDGFVLVQAGFPRRDDEPYEGMFRGERGYVLVGGDGGAAVDLGRHPADEGFLVSGGGLETVSEHPHGKSTLSAVWGDLVIISPNDRFELTAFDRSGAARLVVRVNRPTRTPTQADMEAWFDAFTANDTPEERAAFRRDFDRFPLMESIPAFDAILVDALDHVWVRDFRSPGVTRQTWTVFNPSGAVLGRIDTPDGVDVYEIGADYVLGRMRDDFNVEYVTRWLLVRD